LKILREKAVRLLSHVL